MKCIKTGSLVLLAWASLAGCGSDSKPEESMYPGVGGTTAGMLGAITPGGAGSTAGSATAGSSTGGTAGTGLGGSATGAAGGLGMGGLPTGTGGMAGSSMAMMDASTAADADAGMDMDMDMGTDTEMSDPSSSSGMADPSNCVWARGDDPTEASATAAGPYNVETYSNGFATPAGVTSHTVHYPTDAEPPFAGVAVVPGFVSPESSIQRWGPFLASHGIVTVTIGVPGGDQPNARATKLMGTIASIKAENTRSGSPLEGKLAVGCMGVSGWSMGGGGTLMAVSENPDLKAGVSFAAWGPRGAASNQVPVLMFEATADALAANMSDGFYAQTPNTTPKMLFEVQGSSHNVANSPTNHDGIIGRYGLSWWKVFLEGDERYRQFLTAPFPSITTAKSAHNL